MSFVFFVEPPRPDLNINGVSEFGEISVLLPNATSPFRTDLYVEELQRAFLEKFRIEDDYLVMTGSQLALSFALAVLTSMTDAPVNLLIYDAPNSRYFERRFHARKEILREQV